MLGHYSVCVELKRETEVKDTQTKPLLTFSSIQRSTVPSFPLFLRCKRTRKTKTKTKTKKTKTE